MRIKLRVEVLFTNQGAPPPVGRGQHFLQGDSSQARLPILSYLVGRGLWPAPAGMVPCPMIDSAEVQQL